MNITTQLTQVPDEYRDLVADFISLYAERRQVEIQSLDPPLYYEPIPPATLARCGLAITLTQVANAAAGNLDHHPDYDTEDYVISDVDDIVAKLFDPPVPGYPEVTQAPAQFWATPLGAMCGKALLWAYEGQLITLQEAADVARVSVQAISQAVEAGRLTRFVDPNAPERQGRTLVLKREVTVVAWKQRLSYHKSNRYRRQDKREAFEDALDKAGRYLDEALFDAPTSAFTLINYVHNTTPSLTYAEAREIAAKALRVERGRRIKARAAFVTTPTIHPNEAAAYDLALARTRALTNAELANGEKALYRVTSDILAAQPDLDPIHARDIAVKAIQAVYKERKKAQEETDDQP